MTFMGPLLRQVPPGLESPTTTQCYIPWLSPCCGFPMVTMPHPDTSHHASLAGVSRSTTILVAYLMTVTELGWERCLAATKAVRSYASPNFGFQQQLQEYEQTLLKEVGPACTDAGDCPAVTSCQRRGAVQLRAPLDASVMFANKHACFAYSNFANSVSQLFALCACYLLPGGFAFCMHACKHKVPRHYK